LELLTICFSSGDFGDPAHRLAEVQRSLFLFGALHRQTIWAKQELLYSNLKHIFSRLSMESFSALTPATAASSDDSTTMIPQPERPNRVIVVFLFSYI
jgi:hypothetical protein